MTLKVNFDILRIDVDVLGQYSHQIALQSRQVVGLWVTPSTFVREDKLQAFFSDIGSFFLFAKQEGK